MRRIDHMPGLALALLMVGCASTPPPKPVTPTAPATETPPPVAPAPRVEFRVLPPPPAGIPDPPAQCTALAEHEAAATGCDDLLGALDQALAEEAATARDQALASLEGCPPLAPGIIRVLRAELGPPECSDLLVDPFLAHGSALDADIESALTGLGLAARLSRLVNEPPRLEPPFNKERFQQFAKETLFPWVVEQAKAIGATAIEGDKLEGYGKGIVAVDAGVADMRFVEMVRAVPLPEELAKDAELVDIYYGSLDQALEPRKRRGRDAALVGLHLLAETGVLHDARVDRARALLSKVFNGRRIDALDQLLLPPLEPPPSATPAQRLAARLPTFVAGRVLSEQDPRDPGLLRALMERGLPDNLEQKLTSGALPNPVTALHARARFMRGELYWRAADFAFARKLLEGRERESAEAALVVALAQALDDGPKNAVQMMQAGPLPQGPGGLAALDQLARSQRPTAGMAGFDSAFIRQLAPPIKPDPKFWGDLAKRYDAAAKKLDSPAAARTASELADAARATARTIESAASKTE